jgi:addiction module RelB/DinJ family antitoxin
MLRLRRASGLYVNADTSFTFLYLRPRVFAPPVDIRARFAYNAIEVIIMPNARSCDMHIRVDPEVKAKAAPILDAIGLSFSDVFNLTLNQIYLKRKIPFELSGSPLTENGYTPEFEAELLRDAEETYAAVANGTAKVYATAAEMFADWDEDEDE